MTDEDEQRRAWMKAFDYYGRYDTLPSTLAKLFVFEQELRAEGQSFDSTLGFMLETEDTRYRQTPPDVIPFARPGVDGIHYGFLTEFGQVSDLEQAYIVCVSPMDFGNEIWIVARNIREFLRVVYSENTILFNYFPDIESYISCIENSEVDEPDERVLYVKEKLKERFSIEPITDMPQYITSLQKQRQAQIVVNTLNALGIIQSYQDQNHKHERFMFGLVEEQEVDEENEANEENDQDDERDVELECAKLFFWRVTLESKLAFIRDCQTNDFLDDAERRKWLVGELESMKLENEAARLELSYLY